MALSRGFQLIDLDRTLFDTALFARAINEQVNIDHPGLGDVLQKKLDEAYAKEETFFLLQYLRKEMGDAGFEALVARAVQKYGSEAFKLSGYADRLAYAEELKKNGIDWGVFTYGDVIDQEMKLNIIGLNDAQVYHTETPNKAEVIASWIQEDGTFVLPPEYNNVSVTSITLEDDKFRAFQDLPENVHGIWITFDEHATERASVFDGAVAIARNLNESIEHLRQQYA